MPNFVLSILVLIILILQTRLGTNIKFINII